MNDQAGAPPRRRLKLKAAEAAPITVAKLKKARKKLDAAAVPTPEPAQVAAMRSANGLDAPPSAHVATAAGHVVFTTLQGRHYEWLQAIARLEGRTLPQMLERLVRIGYSQDHGKARSTGATQVGSSPGGDGHSGAHPARGSE